MARHRAYPITAACSPKTLTLNRAGEIQRFEYKYGVTDINTGAVDESKNAGQLGRVESFISNAKQWQQRYNYDAVNRLTKAKEVRGDNSQQVWQVAYTYDRWGNRFQSGAENSGIGYEQVVTSDINTTNNRFNSTAQDPVAYDDAGQMTADGKFRGMNYQYDANGRMRGAYRYENGGYTTASYDGEGHRVQTTLGGVTRNFIYNLSGNVIAEYRQGVLDREYVYQGQALLASEEQPRACTITTEQYLRNFYTGTLGRQPNSTELQQWTTAIDQALAQGYGAVLGQVRNLGTTLFTSQEYINRNRTNSEFVIDLYWGYLHRTYDQGGYDNWMATLNAGYTREHVRGGFAFSVEFENNATTICTTIGGVASVKYLFTDYQGSTRAVMDGSGNVVGRHDYLPFGEELWSGVGMRTSTQQFGNMDQNRMRYALMEKDEGTGLDHTWWRKYEAVSGRWTSPDPVNGRPQNPQSFNRFSYVQNDPIGLVDPTGLMCYNIIRTDVYTDTGQIIGQYIVGSFCNWDGYETDFDRRLRDAKEDLRNRILTRPKCAALLGKSKDPKKAIQKALKALDTSNITPKSFGGPQHLGSGMIFYNKPDAVAKGKNITINSDGRFMAVNGSLPVTNAPGARDPLPPGASVTGVNYYGLDDVQSASFILAHEVGHRQGIYGKDDKMVVMMKKRRGTTRRSMRLVIKTRRRLLVSTRPYSRAGASLILGAYFILAPAIASGQMRTTMRSNHASSAKAKLQLTFDILEQRYCSDDDIYLVLRLRFTNTGRQPLILYKYSTAVVGYMISRSLQASAAKNYESNPHLMVNPIMPGPHEGAAPDASVYQILKGGESLEAKTDQLILLDKHTPRPVDRFLEIKVQTWYGTQRPADVRERWLPYGILWSDSVTSRPVRFTIEKQPPSNKVGCAATPAS